MDLFDEHDNLEMENMSVDDLKTNPDNVKYISINERIKSDNKVQQLIETNIDNGIIPHPDDCIDSFGEFVDPTVNTYIHCDNSNCRWHSYIPQPSQTTVQKLYQYTISDEDNEEFNYSLCDECHVTKQCILCVNCWQLFDRQYIHVHDEHVNPLCMECFEAISNNPNPEHHSYKTEIISIDLEELLMENELNTGLFFTGDC